MNHQKFYLKRRLLCIAILLLSGCMAVPTSQEITVKRINIVDESGETRLIIAGDLPDPVIRGQQLERSIAPSGIIWHDQDGNESGGLTISQFPPDDTAKARMLTFDFTRQITDAVNIGTFESKDGDQWWGGLTVYDRRPYKPGPVSSSQGVKRIFLGNRNQDAALVIHDNEGRERIRIGVNPEGEAVFEMLDEQGEVVYRVPAASDETEDTQP